MICVIWVFIVTHRYNIGTFGFDRVRDVDVEYYIFR